MTYYDINGDEISLERFSELCRDLDYRRIGRTRVGDAMVSTVWLGINHNWSEGRPHIFETMIFKGDDTGEEECWRYPTLERAIAGHQQQVAILELETDYAEL